MASDNLQIPDILSNQNQKEATANAQTNLLDRALNNNATFTAVAGVNQLTTALTRENIIIEILGTPGAAFTLEMPDTNKRLLMIVNNSDDVCTVENSVGAGSGTPVISVGEGAIFHYDGTDFFDLTNLAVASSTFLGLTDAPSSFAGQSGKQVVVNDAVNAVEFLPTVTKPVRAATAAAGTLATDFENGDTIDAVVLATNDRILIKDQAAGAENGVYVVQATGAPTRAGDFNDNDEVSNTLIPVLEGTANGSTLFHHSTAGAIVLDTTILTFASLLSTSSFTALSDTPSGYTNESGKTARVNAAANAVEFVPDPNKDPVRAATVAAGTLASDFENGDTIDGVVLATNDRILIKNQASGEENGIYVVQATGAPTRALDWDDNDDAVRGSIIPVIEGTTNATSSWMMTTSGAITVGTTVVVFEQTAGTGGSGVSTATVQTTDATITNIATVALASGEASIVRGFGIGTEPSSGNSLAFDFLVAGKNNGGTSAIIGAGAVINTLDGDGGASWAFTADVDDASDAIRLRVTGEAATTINWTINYETVTET